MENTIVEKAKVIDSNNCDNVGYKIVETKHNRYMVYENIRKEAGEFDAKYHCSICDPDNKKFHPKLLKIITEDSKFILVCRSCICNMEEVLKAAQAYDCKHQIRDDNNIKQRRMINAEP